MAQRTSDAAALVLAGLVLGIIGPIHVSRTFDAVNATDGATLLPSLFCSLVGLVLVVAGVMTWAKGRHHRPR